MVYKKIVAVRRTINPAMQKASKALALASKVARAINSEKKYHDVYVNQNINTGQVLLLNGIAQGDTGQSRDGDQIKMLSMQYKINIQNNDSAHMRYRYLVVLDKQADGTPPTISEVLQSTTGPADTWVSPYNMDNKLRFQVLEDKSGQVLFGESKNVHIGQFYHKFKGKADGLHVRYNGSTGSASDLTTNPIYFIYEVDSPTNVPTLDFYSRIRYVDN